jgi:uncharacterized membrane protein
MHPLHPMSVHAPVACMLFTPLADLGAHITHQSQAWTLGALTSAGALLFGLLAAMLGALDFERARTKAPRTIIAHVSAMSGALVLSAVSLFGRVDADFTVAAPPPLWAIGGGVLAAAVMFAGAYFGGELVYRHGVNVGPKT